MTSDNLLRTDLVHEVDLFLQQGHWLSDLNPDSTLYALAFGIAYYHCKVAKKLTDVSTL
jgi:hypothetical protein